MLPMSRTPENASKKFPRDRENSNWNAFRTHLDSMDTGSCLKVLVSAGAKEPGDSGKTACSTPKESRSIGVSSRSSFKKTEPTSAHCRHRTESYVLASGARAAF